MVNIFRLHDNPKQAAQSHCDQHIGSAIHETGLILSTALREYADWNDDTFFERTDADPDDDQFYGASHTGHPLNEWVTLQENWEWALDYLHAAYCEKLYRWGGGHNTWENYATYLPREIPAWDDGSSPQYLAIADDIRSDEDDPVIAYRRYYIESKGGVDGWMEWQQNREPPTWLELRDPYHGLPDRQRELTA